MSSDRRSAQITTPRPHQMLLYSEHLGGVVQKVGHGAEARRAEQYVEFQFPNELSVSGIVTQGKNGRTFLRSYRVRYHAKDEAGVWQDAGLQEGNQDPYKRVIRWVRFRATAVRIYPVTYEGAPDFAADVVLDIASQPVQEAHEIEAPVSELRLSHTLHCWRSRLETFLGTPRGWLPTADDNYIDFDLGNVEETIIGLVVSGADCDLMAQRTDGVAQTMAILTARGMGKSSSFVSFAKPFSAQKVRIVVLKCLTQDGLRLDLMLRTGRILENPPYRLSSEVQGVLRVVSDCQGKDEIHHGASQSYLTSQTAWCPSQHAHQAMQFLEFRMPRPMYVDSVVTAGRCGVPCSAVYRVETQDGEDGPFTAICNIKLTHETQCLQTAKLGCVARRVRLVLLEAAGFGGLRADLWVSDEPSAEL